MPSSHAQSMCYFLCMLCIKQSRLTDSSSATPLLLSGIATYVFLARYGDEQMVLLCLCDFLCVCCYFSFWRVRSHLHTVAQTLTGAVLGVSFSLVWLYLERFVLSIEQYCIGFPGQHFMLCNHQLEYLLLEQVRLEYNHGRGPPLQLKLATLCCAIGAIYIYKRGVYPVSHTEHGVGISTPPVRSPGADRVPSSARRVHTSVTSLS